MFQNAGNRRRETKERTDEMEQKKEIRIGGKKLARARSEEKKTWERKEMTAREWGEI